jgi:hypothetical protein
MLFEERKEKLFNKIREGNINLIFQSYFLLAFTNKIVSFSFTFTLKVQIGMSTRTSTIA